MTDGRLVLLGTTHRVAPGLLTWSAWDVLRAAPVYAGFPEHPLAAALADADVEVRVLDPVEGRSHASALLDLARGRTVVWLVAPEGDAALSHDLAAEMTRMAGQGVEMPEVEVLQGSWDLPGSRLLDLVAVMDRLRSPGGCPWDAEQTHETLLPYLLEEAYETVEAIETGDRDSLREELGDLLLQVAFHARVAEEDSDLPWSIDDVAAGIVDKLVRRHPHVFAGVDAATAEEVETNWEQLKRAEKGRASVVDGVPMGQPALALAAKLMSRAGRAGINVEVGEPDLAAEISDETLGELLLGLVAVARAQGLDPEAALREAARGYAGRIRAAESQAQRLSG
jgi:XTP/dITP diphosphohydrolase